MFNLHQLICYPRTKQVLCYRALDKGGEWNATMTLEFRADPATVNHVTLSAMDWVFVSPPNSYVEALIANMMVFGR